MSLCVCGHLLGRHELPTGDYGWNRNPLCLVGVEDGERCRCEGYQVGESSTARRWPSCRTCGRPTGPNTRHGNCGLIERDRREQAERARREAEERIEPERRRARTSIDPCVCAHEERTHELPNVDGLNRKCVKPGFTYGDYRCECQDFAFDEEALDRRRPILMGKATPMGIVCACGHVPDDHYAEAPFRCANACKCIAFNVGGQTVAKLQEPDPIEGAGLPPDPGKRKIDL